MKHTPGPWEARVNSWSRWEIHYASGQLAMIAKWDDPASPPPIAQMDANALLIAAAPDLLSGCNALLGLLELIGGRDDLPPTLREALIDNHRIAEARSAVAKAEGCSEHDG